MLIALMSDLHVDHYSSRVGGLLDHFEKMKIEPADVCVLAGDIADGRIPDQYRQLFTGLRRWFAHVVIVTGNHDYYKSTLGRTHRSIEVAIQACATQGIHNIHHLHRSSVVIDGQTFHGATMWYPNREGNVAFRHYMNDDNYIRDFDWDYTENELFELHLRQKLAPGDIVVTHHLPSNHSVAPKYKRHETNRFYVSDMEWLMTERRPLMWLHGHTHEKCLYAFDATLVACNPRGYPRENPGDYEPLYLDTEED